MILACNSMLAPMQCQAGKPDLQSAGPLQLLTAWWTLRARRLDVLFCSPPNRFNPHGRTDRASCSDAGLSVAASGCDPRNVLAMCVRIFDPDSRTAPVPPAANERSAQAAASRTTLLFTLAVRADRAVVRPPHRLWQLWKYHDLLRGRRPPRSDRRSRWWADSDRGSS